MVIAYQNVLQLLIRYTVYKLKLISSTVIGVTVTVNDNVYGAVSARVHPVHVMNIARAQSSHKLD